MQNPDFASCVCRDHEPDMFDRLSLFLPMILIMFASFFVLFVLGDHPVGLVFTSFIPYTSLVVLATFSAQRGQQPYFFECPIVQKTMPQLLLRHLKFLIALIFLEVMAFYLSQYLPAAWLIAKGKDGSLFDDTLFILCICLALGQILSNRSLLERVHLKTHLST